MSILSTQKLSLHWQTEDPFLFTAHHADFYPEGAPDLGLKNRSLLKGREMGMDFTVKDGFRYYHGDVVPGFPAHPHSGFETITIARKGLIDHTGSDKSEARYGDGDVQWMTAGSGIAHCEMFPLVNQNGPNTCELFQIWLNLPKKSKRVPAAFKMLWAEDVPKGVTKDENGNEIQLTVIAQSSNQPMPLNMPRPPTPAPDSYGATEESYISIWIIKLSPGAKWTLPGAPIPQINRNLYFFEGKDAVIAGKKFGGNVGVKLAPMDDVELENQGSSDVEFLLMSAKPLQEPVVQQGPFVGNSREDIIRAYMDYQRGVFGKWPFESSEPTHGQKGRFALYPDGTLVEPPKKSHDEL